MRPSCVSTHAIIRYIQRVLGVVVPLPDWLDDPKFNLALHCYAANTTPATIEQMVLTKVVRDALELGATQIRTDYGKLIIKHGVIVTIIDPGSNWYRPKRFKQFSKRERHVEAQRTNRRRKGVPV